MSPVLTRSFRTSSRKSRAKSVLCGIGIIIPYILARPRAPAGRLRSPFGTGSSRMGVRSALKKGAMILPDSEQEDDEVVEVDLEGGRAGHRGEKLRFPRFDPMILCSLLATVQ